MKIFKLSKIAVYISVVTAFSGASVFAASNSTLTQSITAGVLSSDVLTSLRSPVAAPTAAMSAKQFSFNCQNGVNASSGALGTDSERLYVSNPSAAANGWTLSIAATAGASAAWQNAGATKSFDYNDPTTGGCSDGVDTDTAAGQLTIDPSIGSLITDCSACTTTGVTKGSSASFSEGTINSITLLSAAANSDDVWRGYLTAVDLKQTIPAETPVDAYSINLTLTATAL